MASVETQAIPGEMADPTAAPPEEKSADKTPSKHFVFV